MLEPSSYLGIKLFNRNLINFLLTLYCYVLTIILIYVYSGYNLFVIQSENRLNSSDIVIESNPRILCLVTTQPKNHNTSALAVKQTWGKRCDITYFVSSQSDQHLPAIQVKCSEEDHDHIWCKVRAAIIYAVYKYQGQFDWVLKADDDTYVIIENLKYLVSKYNSSQPIWFGCPFALEGDLTKQYMSGGAGYVISKEAINRLAQEFKHAHKCNRDDLVDQTGAEDVKIGKCLKKLDVKYGDSRDDLDKKRFFPFEPDFLLDPISNVYDTDWFGEYSVYHYKQGLNCCSNTSISFHYLEPQTMYVFDFFIYNLKIN